MALTGCPEQLSHGSGSLCHGDFMENILFSGKTQVWCRVRGEMSGPAVSARPEELVLLPEPLLWSAFPGAKQL